MATISNEGGGRRRIQFMDPNGQRQSIGLGQASLRTAENWRSHVTHLVHALGHAQPVPDETVAWVAKLGDTLSAKLAKVGLIPRRQNALLAAFIDGYITARGDVKKSTATVYGNTRRCLIAYFGSDKPLRDITAGDADHWQLWLRDHEEVGSNGKPRRVRLAENTVRRRCGHAKQFFRAAQRQRLVVENPFTDLVAAVKANKAREYFLSRVNAAKVLDSCPDSQWRLLFALARWGGLRCPSEHLALTWGDIDWEGARMLVRSPKTEHHEGGESRMVPLFPEILPHLQVAFREAEEREDWSMRPDRPMSAEPVITMRRDAKQNMRTQFTKIIRRAGLKPWPKLFQNLRSTRETELAEEWPIHVVCSWIGNSEAVAKKHYLQVTDEHFQRAATEPTWDAEKTVQKTVQNTATWGCTDEHPEKAVVMNPLQNTGNPSETALVGILQGVVTGLELDPGS